MAQNPLASRALQLPGSVLSGVCFIWDYIELHFDRQILRVITSPTIQKNGLSTAYPEVGAHEALCRLIGQKVTGTRLLEGILFEVVFESETKVIVPLGRTCGGESMHFSNGTESGLEIFE